MLPDDPFVGVTRSWDCVLTALLRQDKFRDRRQYFGSKESKLLPSIEIFVHNSA
jgi:hypothetical protein